MNITIFPYKCYDVYIENEELVIDIDIYDSNLSNVARQKLCLSLPNRGSFDFDVKRTPGDSYEVRILGSGRCWTTITIFMVKRKTHDEMELLNRIRRALEVYKNTDPKTVEMMFLSLPPEIRERIIQNLVKKDRR